MYIVYDGYREYLKHFGHVLNSIAFELMDLRGVKGTMNRRLHAGVIIILQNAKMNPTWRCSGSHPATLPACCYAPGDSGSSSA